MQRADLELHLLAQRLVERAQRLVEQHDRRLEHHRAGQRDALLLPAGKLRRAAVAEPGRRTISRARATRAARSAFGTPRASSGKATFSATVMCGKSA